MKSSPGLAFGHPFATIDAWTFQPVRLIGVSAERLSNGDEQMSLFSDPERERQRKLDAVADEINQKFQKRTIRRGVRPQE